MSERDVTDEVEWRAFPPVQGKLVREELWHAQKRIGYVEPMGPVLTDKSYKLSLKPSRTSVLEQRILRVEP